MAQGVKNVTVTTSGPSQWIPINQNQFHDGVGLMCTLRNGTATYNVEVTGDKLGPAGPAGIVNVNLHDTLNNLTTSKNGSLAFPCTAIRINPSVISVGALLTLSVVQMGS